MKRKMNLMLAAFIVLVAMSLQNLIAQTNHPTALTLTTAQSVNINSSYHYGVDSIERSGISNIYNWTITGVPSPVAGTHYIMTPVSATNNSQKKIQWLIAGSYTVNLTEANPAAEGGCSVVQGTIAVTVNAAPTAKVGFTNATGTNQCSDASNTAYPIRLTVTGTPSYPLQLTYSETKNSVTTTGNTVSVASPGTSVTIPSTDGFTSSLLDDTGRRITITGVTDSFGGTLGIDNVTASATHTLTIWAVPVTTTIHHD